MAWSYSVLIHGYTSAGVFYDVDISETATDTTNNTSTLTITHKIRIMSEWGGNYEIPYNTPIYVTIDGTKYTYTPSMPTVYAGQTKTITTTTHTITHSSDGTKTAVVNCRWNDSSRSYQGETGNKSLTLTTIPRASTMTLPSSQTMGSAVTFTITKASSAFTHTITYSFNGHTGTAVSSTSSTTPSFTPAIATFAPWLTNATSGSISYTLNTYSGSTLVGSKSYSATLAVPSSVTIKMASSNPLTITALNGFNNQILAGKSSARLTASVDTSSEYGATPKNYAFSVKNSSGTVVYSGNNPSTSSSAYMDSSVLTTAGTYTAAVTVTDTRGRTATASRTFTVTAYSIPVINTVTIFRCDSSGNASDSGTYASIKANATYASGVSGNSLTMIVATKKNTDSSYGTAQSLTNGTAKVLSGFDADSIYNILITASDTIGASVQYTGTLSNVDVGIAWDAVNDNMGLLTYPPSGAGADQVYMPKGYAIGPDGAFSELITKKFLGEPSRSFISLPILSYRDLGVSSSDNEGFYKAWLKYIVAHYASSHIDVRDATTPIVALVVPADRGLVLGNIYSTTDLVDNFPRYSFFLVQEYGGTMRRFGTINGAWWYNTISNGSISAISAPVSIANGGTGATSAANARYNLAVPAYIAYPFNDQKTTRQSQFISLHDAAVTVNGVTIPKWSKGVLSTNGGADAAVMVVDTLGNLWTAWRGSDTWSAAKKYGATSLYNSTLSSGSVTLTNGAYYEALIVVGTLDGSIMVSQVIPVAMLTTSDTKFQLNDESYFTGFNLKISGADVIMTYRSRSNSNCAVKRVFGYN